MKKFFKPAAFLVMFLFASAVIAAEWYQGGTLHQSSGLEWQKANYANKLATSGDLIATVIQGGKLNPELAGQIKSMDDLKVLSAALVKELDAAFEKEPDPEKNRQLFANQKVSSTAALLMAMTGWIK